MDELKVCSVQPGKIPCSSCLFCGEEHQLLFGLFDSDTLYTCQLSGGDRTGGRLCVCMVERCVCAREDARVRDKPPSLSSTISAPCRAATAHSKDVARQQRSGKTT